jgi:hypothetical protein
MKKIIPVVLFAYARPDHLRRTLACLRANNIPLLYVFADGPRTPDVAERVNDTRNILRMIDWCEVHYVERAENLGLGKSILTGVTEIFKKHETIIVFEDDLICVPGTYQYLCAALEHYKDDPRVMSVTGFNSPDNTPHNINNQPYFDGRSECWVWGAWSRAWEGMDIPAKTLMTNCKKKGIDVYKYGANLPRMAKVEIEQNIWAVRFLYLHILKGGLCLRPPYSMVEHIGYDNLATNTKVIVPFTPPLRKCPPIPVNWPESFENSECPIVWQKTNGGKPDNVIMKAVKKFRKLVNSFKISQKTLF